MPYKKNDIEDLIARRTIDFVEIKIQMENHLSPDGKKITLDEIALSIARLCDNLVEIAQDVAALQDDARKTGWK